MNSRSPQSLHREPIDRRDRGGNRRAATLHATWCRPLPTQRVVDPLAHGRQRMPRRALREGACSSWSSRDRCAGTSRTRSGRRPRRAHRAPASTSRRASGCSTACSTNAGTHWSVTSTRMPSAPRPSATAGRSSVFCVSSTIEQVAGCRHQRRADDLGRDAAESRAGAVGAGRDRARDRLAVDVAEVLHREAVRREQRRDLVQAGAREETSRASARGRPRRRPLRSVEVEQDAGRDGDAGEAVPRADRP